MHFFVFEIISSWEIISIHRHIWYLNGLIFALILIDILSKEFQQKRLQVLDQWLILLVQFLPLFGGHQDKLPALLAFPVNIYFSIFATTRNGLFQSLVFVSLGMYIADIEKSGKLKKTLQNGKIALFAYLIKIPISLIGGAVTSARCLTFQSFSCYSA